ncbi:MAG: DNA polymerase III, subunit gamma and tau [Burkholderiales bacterium RIFOXYC12_FULL_65_23]|uniref:DNA polymerase III subunit gamma/tau n=1 Tax=Malikia spinosa TaxID=86180 RepID=UPI0008B109F0|nr:MAG: DNA polymerase III, subunit gamma and tau [Burkholderiales bacterium RIFOXYC12_FULL_65_23]
MSYVVLARKYRPKNFAEMVGQEHVVQALGNALTTQRLHHAYLFTGTRGVGKTTVSRILAKSLNCTGADGQGGITAQPCGVCDACRDIDAGRFIDYTELDAASNRGVDEVQALLEQAVYKPVQGRFKVFMIDEVHMLTNTAFNAMLKTLEEPPEYLKFVLATTDPQKVPVTVLSRCLQFNLRPMAPETVFEHLGQVLASEGVASEPMALRLLARAARGSMRDALSLTDQAIAFGAGQLQEATVRQMLGAVDRSHVFALIGALAAGDGRTVVETVDALRLNGYSAASTLEEMTGVLQRMAVAQQVPQSISRAEPEMAELLALAQALPPDETQLLYSLCLHGRGELGLAPDEYAALTMVLLRLLAFKPAGAAEKKTLKSAEPAAVQPVPAAAVPVPATALATGMATLPQSDVAPRVAPVLMSAPAPVATSAPASVPADRRPSPAVQPAPTVPVMAVPKAAPTPIYHAPASSAPSMPPVRAAARPGPRPAPAPAMDDGWSSAYGSDVEFDAEAELDAMLNAAPAPAPARYESAPARPASPAPAVAASASAASAAPQPQSQSQSQPQSQQPERPQPQQQAAPVIPAAPGAEADFWFQTVMALSESEVIMALVRELALQSELIARTADEWQLRSANASLLQSAARERLQAALVQAGHAVRLRIELGETVDTPARRLAAAAAERQRQADATMTQDPFVQAMLRDFGGKIVPGSIKPI